MHDINRQNFKKKSCSFYADPDYESILKETGIVSIDDVFKFEGGENLVKDNLADYRSRIKFKTGTPAKAFFLKRYHKPPILVQVKNWFAHRTRASLAFFDFEPTINLRQAGINTLKTVSFGEEWGFLFEKRSFCITEKIADAESLERKLPECFYSPQTVESLKLKREFIFQLARFIRKFHETGYRHRDLYFSHIFYNISGEFYLIDLARAFVPAFLSERFRFKDIAQIFYSAPGKYFSRTDRMRFYLRYTGHKRLTNKDKSFIRKVIRKAWQMVLHDIKHGRAVPFTA
jgi:hypothetical protein